MSVSINNVSYSWSMVQLTSSDLTGKTDANPTELMGVTGIEYNIVRNTATNYGLAGKPVSRGFGNIQYTASITMDYNTVTLLRGSKSSLMDIGEFNLIISFANPMVGQTEEGELSNDYTTHSITLKGCFFNEDGMSGSQDDTTFSKTFDLNPFEIVVSATGGTTPETT